VLPRSQGTFSTFWEPATQLQLSALPTVHGCVNPAAASCAVSEPISSISGAGQANACLPRSKDTFREPSRDVPLAFSGYFVVDPAPAHASSGPAATQSAEPVSAAAWRWLGDAIASVTTGSATFAAESTPVAPAVALATAPAPPPAVTPCGACSAHRAAMATAKPPSPFSSATTAPCAKGCGRPAAQGSQTCCCTCSHTFGRQHAPSCEASQASTALIPSARAPAPSASASCSTVASTSGGGTIGVTPAPSGGPPCVRAGDCATVTSTSGGGFVRVHVGVLEFNGRGASDMGLFDTVQFRICLHFNGGRSATWAAVGGESMVRKMAPRWNEALPKTEAQTVKYSRLVTDDGRYMSRISCDFDDHLDLPWSPSPGQPQPTHIAADVWLEKRSVLDQLDGVLTMIGMGAGLPEYDHFWLGRAVVNLPPVGVDCTSYPWPVEVDGAAREGPVPKLMSIGVEWAR